MSTDDHATTFGGVQPRTKNVELAETLLKALRSGKNTDIPEDLRHLFFLNELRPKEEAWSLTDYESAIKKLRPNSHLKLIRLIRIAKRL